MDPKGRRDPRSTLQKVNAVINETYKNSLAKSIWPETAKRT